LGTGIIALRAAGMGIAGSALAGMAAGAHGGVTLFADTLGAERVLTRGWLSSHGGLLLQACGDAGSGRLGQTG
jgi:hypothetical protein